MCLNCGCGQPNDDRGNPDNITADALQRAADANHQTLRQSAQHILESVERLDAARRGGASGLATPAAASGGRGGAHGTPASES
jgi:hypothetical protein